MIFGSKTPAPAAKTGVDVLRAALRARKGHASLVARDLGIGVAALDAFAYDAGNLPDAILTALAQRFFGDSASFDPEKNLLRRAKQVPLPAAVAPPVFQPTPKVYPLVSPLISSNPQPQVQPKVRADGWAED